MAFSREGHCCLLAWPLPLLLPPVSRPLCSRPALAPSCYIVEPSWRRTHLVLKCTDLALEWPVAAAGGWGKGRGGAADAAHPSLLVRGAEQCLKLGSDGRMPCVGGGEGPCRLGWPAMIVGSTDAAGGGRREAGGRAAPASRSNRCWSSTGGRRSPTTQPPTRTGSPAGRLLQCARRKDVDLGRKS